MKRAGSWDGSIVLQVFLLTVAVMLASDSVFMFSRWCDTWLGIAACLGLLTAVSRGWSLRPAAKIAVVAAMAGCVWAAFRPEHPAARLVCLSWLFALIALLDRWRGGGKAAAWLIAACPATLCYAAAGAAYGQSSSLWRLVERAANLVTPCDSRLGIWVSGLPIFAFGSMLLLSKLLLERGRARGALIAAAPVAGFVAVKVVLDRLAPLTQLEISCCHLTAIGLVAALASPFSRASAPPEAASALRDRASGAPAFPVRSGQFAGALVLTAACLLTMLGPTVHDGLRATSALAKPSFGLYSAGLLDWIVPSDGSLGLANSGMFGLFRRTLEHSAAEAGGRVLDVGPAASDTIGGHAARSGWAAAASSADVGVMVFINPTVKPDPEEVADIRRFVESGGGLLVLGDHTDIGGSREPLNTILSFTGIRFNFDAAVPLRDHWRGCLEIRPNPVTAGLDDDLLLQLAVGASLRIEAPAIPIVVGRYGFADRGDSLNAGQGAFLGDMAQSPGEQVGDVVLVAGERVGRGRVLVFGDTSPFQNAALFLSQRLVANAMAWLAGSAADEIRFSDVVAAVDFSLRPRASLAPFKEASLGGLANCLARAGIQARPALSRRAWTDDCALLFLVAPARLGRSDVTRLLAYMSAGGHLILCQGYAEPQPCASLLARLGFRIEDIPLGNGDSGAAVHKDAWAVSCIGDVPDTTVMASAFGYPTIVRRPYGEGTFTIVGDGRFLLDGNLEGELRGEPRNVTFVHGLVEALHVDGRVEDCARAGKGGEVRYASTPEN